MSVSKRTRFEVLRRDNHTCRYCGASAPDVKLQVDHVVPATLGGTDDPTNLVAACVDCNAGKSSVPADAPLVAEVAADAARWARAMAQAAAQIEAENIVDKELFSGFKAIWLERTYTSSGKRYYPNGNLPDGWEKALMEYHKNGLPVSEIEDAARIVDRLRYSPNDPFSYCIGVLRKKLDAQTATARAILDAEQAE